MSWPNPKETIKFFVCDCYGEGVAIDYSADAEFQMFCLAHFDMQRKAYGWKWRLGQIWRIIRWGIASIDGTVFCRADEVRELGEYILDCADSMRRMQHYREEDVNSGNCPVCDGIEANTEEFTDCCVLDD